MGLHGLRFQVWSMCRKSRSLILPLTNKLGTVFAPGDSYLKKSILTISNAPGGCPEVF